MYARTLASLVLITALSVGCGGDDTPPASTDSGTARVDSGGARDGGPAVDTGTPPPGDSGTTPDDSSTPPVDSGPVTEVDAGSGTLCGTRMCGPRTACCRYGTTPYCYPSACLSCCMPTP